MQSRLRESGCNSDGKDLAPAATAKGDAEDPAPAETAKGDQRLQIAVKISSDEFRELGARQKNFMPGPSDSFSVVSRTVAQHLADVPVALLDLTEVLAEVARMSTRLEDSDSPNERMMYRHTYILHTGTHTFIEIQ